jgi:hypothetical protein
LNEARFTPGPWHYDAGNETITAENGRIVVYELGTNDADGQLIAAAPAMYEALERIYKEHGWVWVGKLLEDVRGKR